MNAGNYHSVAGVLVIFGLVISAAFAIEAPASAPALPTLHADPHIACFNGTYYIYHRFHISDGNGYNREVCISPMRFETDGTIRAVDVFEPAYAYLIGIDPSKDTFAKDGHGKVVLPDEINPTEGPEVIQLVNQRKWYIYGDPINSAMQAGKQRISRPFPR